MGIYHLGKCRCIGFKFLLILLHTLFGLIFTVLFVYFLIVLVEVTYSLVGRLVTCLAVTIGNYGIHLLELFLIIFNIILGECHDAPVVLFNKIHIRIKLCTVHTPYLKAELVTHPYVLFRNWVLKGYCCEGKRIVVVIDTVLNYLNHLQLVILGLLSLAQTVTGIGEDILSGTAVIDLYACLEFVVGIRPIVVTYMLLHERRLCDLVNGFCKRSLVGEISGNLVIDIIAQIVGTEIDIACIGKRAMYLFACYRILIDGVNLITVDNLLAGTAQLYAVKCTGLQ